MSEEHAAVLDQGEPLILTSQDGQQLETLRESPKQKAVDLSYSEPASVPTTPITPVAQSTIPAVERARAKVKKSRREITESSLDTTYHGEVIPPRNLNRTLVLCFDGTGDQFDADNSNIVQLFSMLKKGDIDQQMVYYQAGIGTYTIPQVATPLYSKVSKTLDMMLANNLNHHVMSGYEFLMQNYKQGDKICIFGFSRGAYTARALAGMVHKVGLLPASNLQQVPFAYRMYMQDDKAGWEQSVLFKKTFSIDVDIEFVGVWDTVASVGLFPRRLPFTKSNTAIKTFRHAISLDEHRAKFKANTYNHITKEEAARGDFVVPPEVKAEIDKLVPPPSPPPLSPTHSEPHHEKHDARAILQDIKHAAVHSADAVRRVGRELSGSHRSSIEHLKEKGRDARDAHRHKHGKDEYCPLCADVDPDENLRRRRLEELYTDRSKPTDVLEVWFSGCHCDVGGGSVKNGTRNSLARIPLRWMIRECFRMNTGVQFEADKLRDIGLDPATLWPMVLPRPPPLEVPKNIQGPSAPKPSSKVVRGVKSHVKRPSSIDKTLVKGDRDLIREKNKTIDLGDEDAGEEDSEEEVEEEVIPFTTEEVEELNDALSPIYDQLKLSKGWWVLEFFPMRQRVQRDDGTWKKRVEMNLARPRVLPGQKRNGVKVHRSVKMRMQAEHLKYKPRLEFDVEPTWVD